MRQETKVLLVEAPDKSEASRSTSHVLLSWFYPSTPHLESDVWRKPRKRPVITGASLKNTVFSRLRHFCLHYHRATIFALGYCVKRSDFISRKHTRACHD